MIATLYRKSAHIGQQQGLTALAISHLSPTRVVVGLVVSQRPLPTRYTTMNDTAPTLSTEARTTSISSVGQPRQDSCGSSMFCLDMKIDLPTVSHTLNEDTLRKQETPAAVRQRGLLGFWLCRIFTDPA